MINIKYKAKRKDNGKWVKGVPYETTPLYCFQSDYEKLGQTFVMIYPGFADWGMPRPMEMVEIKPETICISTNYFDDNKTEIFQNDIVQFWIGRELVYQKLVWYNKEMQAMTAISLDGIHTNGQDYYDFKHPNAKYEDFCLMLQDPWGDFSKIEVIGNVFDNPELIQEALNGQYTK